MAINHAALRRMQAFEKVEEKLDEVCKLLSDCWRTDDRSINEACSSAYALISEARFKAGAIAREDEELHKLAGRER